MRKYRKYKFKTRVIDKNEPIIYLTEDTRNSNQEFFDMINTTARRRLYAKLKKEGKFIMEKKPIRQYSRIK